MEYQALCFPVGEAVGIQVQAFLAGLLPHPLGIDAAAVIAQGDNVVRALLADIDTDHARVGLAGSDALAGGFDTVVESVAHHVLEYDLAAGVTVAVQLAGLVHDPEDHGLAQLGTDGADDTAQARHQAGHWHHPSRADGRPQGTDHARLLLQQHFRGRGVAAGKAGQLIEIVHRLTQDTGCLVHVGVLVHFQRIEIAAGRTAMGCHAEQGAVGYPADVGPQGAETAQQLAGGTLALQGALRGTHTELLHFVAEVEQVVQGVGADAYGLLRAQSLGACIGNLFVFATIACCQRLQLRSR